MYRIKSSSHSSCIHFHFIDYFFFTHRVIMEDVVHFVDVVMVDPLPNAESVRIVKDESFESTEHDSYTVIHIYTILTRWSRVRLYMRLTGDRQMYEFVIGGHGGAKVGELHQMQIAYMSKMPLLCRNEPLNM